MHGINVAVCNPTTASTTLDIGQSEPRDCADVMAAGVNASGVYTVYVGRTDQYLHPLHVYCDMDTDSGGWTVIDLIFFLRI